MTQDQAYSIIGIPTTCSLPEIERAYKDKLLKLQLQLTAGQSLSLRQRAQQQIAQLVLAWQVLQDAAAQSSGYPQGGGQSPFPLPTGRSPLPMPAGRSPLPMPAGGGPSPMPTGSSPPPPQGGKQNWPGFATITPLSKPALITSFLIAALVMLFIMLLCFNVFAQSGRKVYQKSHDTTASSEIDNYAAPIPRQDHMIAPGKTSAQLHILSVPWSHVGINGRPMCPNGQADGFELTEAVEQRSGRK